MIDLNSGRHLPLYESIYRQLRAEIDTGQRKSGEKLPSKRALAESLGVSVNTVEGAYRQLESEGYIAARPRSGFYVQPLSYLSPGLMPAPSPAPPHEQAPVAVDFAVGAVDEGLFPMAIWQRLTRSSLNSPDILCRSAPQGDLGLRQELVRYLSRARGIHCTAEQVLLGSGTDELLRVLSTLLPQGCTFAVENPAYHRAYHHFSRMGHTVMPAQMDGKGVLLEPLEALDDVVVYTAPSHQYPLGFAMPMGRRTELLSWCSRGSFRYVIEDDYDSEFRYDARPLPSLQSIDRAERVVYLGTMSGVIAPSLCISYMILPHLLLPGLSDYRCHISTLAQFTLREFMAQGYFEKHLNRMRVCYRNRRRELIALLKPYRPRLRVIGAQAGSFLLVQVAGAAGEKALCNRALSQGVRVYPISPYFMDATPPEFENTVLLGFGNLQPKQLACGVSLLAKAWSL